jgi:hypothetical protein
MAKSTRELSKDAKLFVARYRDRVGWRLADYLAGPIKEAILSDIVLHIMKDRADLNPDYPAGRIAEAHTEAHHFLFIQD